jgi:predicted RNA methylase
MKLTKPERKAMDNALKRLNAGDLSDREALYRDIKPYATTDIGAGGAFFTPWDLAGDFQIETLNWHRKEPKRVLDLCAGYGILSYRQWERWGNETRPAVTCVEINEEYAAIGRQIFPEAEWIVADVFDVPEILKGRQFEEFYSNPPFMPVPKGRRKQHPTAPSVPHAVAEIGMRLCTNGGTMILPRGATNWEYSGRQSYTNTQNARYESWSRETGLTLAANCGIDCTYYDGFDMTNIVVEIALVQDREPEPAAPATKAAPAGLLF